MTGGKAPRIFNLGVRWRWMVAYKHRPRRNSPGTHNRRRRGGVRGGRRPWSSGEKKNGFAYIRNLTAAQRSNLQPGNYTNHTLTACIFINYGISRVNMQENTHMHVTSRSEVHRIKWKCLKCVAKYMNWELHGWRNTNQWRTEGEGGFGGFKHPKNFQSFDKVEPDCKLGGKCLVFLFQHPN